MAPSTPDERFYMSTHFTKNRILRSVLFESSQKSHLQQTSESYLEELEWFQEGNVTDILFPFRNGGLGLPSWLDDKSRRLFDDRQQDVLLEGERKLAEALSEGNLSLQHYALPHDGIRRCFVMNNQESSVPLGAGDCGRVFAVRHNRQDYALKRIIRPGVKQEDEDKRWNQQIPKEKWEHLESIASTPRARYPDFQQESFEGEKEALKRLLEMATQKRFRAVKENHIINIVATFTDPNAFYILLSPVALCNLEDLLLYYLDPNDVNESNSKTDGYQRLASKRLDRKAIENCLRESLGCMIAVVLFLHNRAQIRHRDINPRNVLIMCGPSSDTTPRICLCDFGMAHDFSGGKNSEMLGSSIVDTPRYTTPERIAERPQDLADDMYCLGLVFLDIFAALNHAWPRESEIQGGHEGQWDKAKPPCCSMECRIPIKGYCFLERDVHEWLENQRSDTEAAFGWETILIDWIKRLVSSATDQPSRKIGINKMDIASQKPTQKNG